MTKGKRFECIFLGVSIIFIVALLIVLYQVNLNGKNRAIIVQNSVEGTNQVGDNYTGSNSTGNNSTGNNNTGSNSTGSNSTGSNSTGSNSTVSNSTESNSTESNSTGSNSTGNNNAESNNDQEKSSNNGLINLNTATLEELQTLKGIGPSKAQAIIDYRNTQGNFKNISEITNVSGIGEKTFEKIKEYITVGKE